MKAVDIPHPGTSQPQGRSHHDRLSHRIQVQHPQTQSDETNNGCKASYVYQ